MNTRTTMPRNEIVVAGEMTSEKIQENEEKDRLFAMLTLLGFMMSTISFLDSQTKHKK